jgi:hypothetical protein
MGVRSFAALVRGTTRLVSFASRILSMPRFQRGCRSVAGQFRPCGKFVRLKMRRATVVDRLLCEERRCGLKSADLSYR